MHNEVATHGLNKNYSIPILEPEDSIVVSVPGRHASELV